MGITLIGGDIKKKEVSKSSNKNKLEINNEKKIKKKVNEPIKFKKKVIKKSVSIPNKKFKIQVFGKKLPEEQKIKKIISKHKIEKKKESKVTLKTYAAKEIFEKFGAGFVSQQYLNVLFSQIGASFFMIGMFHGLKELAGIFTSIFSKEYLSTRNPDNWVINALGVFLGISYLLVAVGLFTTSVYLVGTMLIIAGVITTYLGQIYAKCYINDIKKRPILSNFPQYSVTMIGLSLILGSYVLDNYPLHGKLIAIGSNFGLPGYFLLLSLASICFVISSQFLKKLVRVEKFEIKASIKSVIKEYLVMIKQIAPTLFKNRVIAVALIAGAMTGIVQTLGNIYYGLYIYKMFRYIGFGGFTNIAMIFIISIFSALMASTISKLLSKKYGNLPLLTFGTLMVAIQPLAYYFSPNLLAISMATMVGVIGASLTGLAIGLLVSHALEKEHRSNYYKVFSSLITIPYIIFIPIGSYIAQIVGLKILFLILSLLLIFLVTPIYFILQVSLGKKTA